MHGLVLAIGIGQGMGDKNYGTGFCGFAIFANSLGIVMAIALNQIIDLKNSPLI